MTSTNKKSCPESTLLNNAEEFFTEFFKKRITTYDKRKVNDFKTNPFIIRALAKSVANDINANSKAKALVYPYALGTSITTAFGSQIQKFITKTVPTCKPSLVEGMDIEYTDMLDGRTKYCQLKSGPQTINKDDIETIESHFTKARRLAVTNNNSNIKIEDFVLGVIYGSHEDLSTMYKKIEEDGFIVLSGTDFWNHLTGYDDMYDKLVNIAQNAAEKSNMKKSIDNLIKKVENYITKHPDLF
ncbi:PmeII family type II restriction endonuclease [Ligilactobacillus sp. LYQ135]